MSDDEPQDQGEPKNLQLALVRRNPWFLALGALPLVAAIGLLVAGIISGEHVFWALIPHMFILSGALGSMMWIRNPRPREIEGNLAISSEGVRVGETLTLPRERIEAGFVVPRPDKRPIVRLEGKRRLSLATEIRVESEDEGREVLRRLGLDASQKIASFVLPSRVFSSAKSRRLYGLALMSIFALFATLMTLMNPNLEILLMLYGLSLIGVGAAVFATRTNVQIGADGIFLRWFRTERFIPYEKIKSIQPYEEKRFQRRRWAGAKVYLDTGEEITLPVSAAGEVGGPRVRLVTNRLQEALADHQRGVRAAAEARLMRGDRLMEAWVRALRRAGAGAEANHRIAPIPTDRLLDVMEDAHADPVMRANAAVALAADPENAEVRKRIRVAAQATAAPRLRVALEKAADVDDEAALAEALAEVESETKKATTMK